MFNYKIPDLSICELKKIQCLFSKEKKNFT